MAENLQSLLPDISLENDKVCSGASGIWRVSCIDPAYVIDETVEHSPLNACITIINCHIESRDWKGVNLQCAAV